MALLTIKPTSWGTTTSYNIMQDGSVAYAVDDSGAWGLNLALLDRQASDDVLLGAKKGAPSTVSITGPAGEHVATVKLSCRRFVELSFVYGGKQYRWINNTKWATSKFKFTLEAVSSSREIATLKQESNWKRDIILDLHVGACDPLWRSLVLLTAALAFKQGQEAVIALSNF